MFCFSVLERHIFKASSCRYMFCLALSLLSEVVEILNYLFWGSTFQNSNEGTACFVSLLHKRHRFKCTTSQLMFCLSPLWDRRNPQISCLESAFPSFQNDRQTASCSVSLLPRGYIFKISDDLLMFRLFLSPLALSSAPDSINLSKWRYLRGMFVSLFCSKELRTRTNVFVCFSPLAQNSGQESRSLPPNNARNSRCCLELPLA